MIATAFDEDNFVLSAPEGTAEGDGVHCLSVYRGPMEGGIPVVVSCWKPTKDELAEITRTGRVWLTVMGTTMPPVAVSGFSPFPPARAGE